MRRIKKTVLFSVLIVAVCMIFAYPTKIKAEKPDTIADGVYIGSVHVGGMTAEEAAAAIDDYVAVANQAVITLSAGEKSIEVIGEQLGIHVLDANVVQEAMDVGRVGSLIKRYKDKKDLEQGAKVIPLILNVDTATVTALLEEEADNLNQDAVNNGLVRKDGEFQFIEGAQGIAVNVTDSVSIIVHSMNDGWDGTDTRIELAAEIVEPLGSKEELSKIQDLLGSYTTNYSDSTQNRCTNISIAAGLIDGTVLYPGEEFSVAAAIGPLDASNGYELAGAYENGQTVQSYGGGVCQVSSTLYNAVILAELEITERSNHSMIVTYVKPSMDAAIAGDYKDLKFVNNRETPIYLEGYTVGKNVYFNIYGEETRADNRKVTYESEVVSQEDPPTQFVGTADPAGQISVAQSKHTGYVARLWKVVTVDGTEESREVYNKSTYKSSPKIVNVGTASEDPNVTAAINAAIATQDEATIYAAVSPYTPNASTVINPAPPAVTPEEQAITGTVDESQITNGEE
ncbi:MAG: VanW family protein [Roseburia sp.]|nr:VanW family protein [Roseburia sp.]